VLTRACVLQVRSWRKMLTEEQQEQDNESEQWMACHTQPCPSCSAKVQRSGGCNHMICTVCGQHFCYVCGQDWSQHGPQSGGFYVCTLRPQAQLRDSPLTALTQSVGQVLRSTLRMIYTRQSQAIRRYFAQSDDTREVHRLVTHVNTLLTEALPGEERADADKAQVAGGASPVASPVASAAAAALPSTLQAYASSVRSSVDASLLRKRGAPCGERAAEGAMLAACSRSGSLRDTLAGSQAGSAVALPALHADAYEVACGARTCPHSPAALGAHAAREHLGSRAAGCSHSSGQCGLAPVERRGAAGKAAALGLDAARRKRLSADAPMGSILEEWERSVETGRTVLRNTCIATYYMERCAAREHLESLQSRLELQVGQLTEMLRALPHHRSVLNGAHADAGRAALHATDPISALLGLISAVVGEIGRGVVSLVEAMLSSRGSVLREISVQGQQARTRLDTAACCTLIRAAQRPCLLCAVASADQCCCS
jgi:IBR domain, a half RING-finger domain